MRIPATLRHLAGPVELLHAEAGPHLLRLVRLGVIGLWIAKLLLDPIWRLAELPTELYRPIGLLAWLPGLFPPPWSATTLCVAWLATLLVLLAALTDRAFAVTSTVAAILLTGYSCLIRGFGSAVHTDIVLLLAMDALALFAWADLIEAWRMRGRVASAWSSFPLVVVVAFLCLTYCLVGLNRVFVSPAAFTGNSMESWAVDASLRGYYFNTEIGWHLPQYPLGVFFLWLGLPVVTLLEVAAPLCLILPRFRWIFIPVMLSFHFMSLVLMNIFFFDDMLLYLLLIDWSRRFPGLRARA